MNYGVYGNYRKIRNASWKCLIDCNITSLPVSLDKIITKSDIHVKYEKSPNILEYDEKGASILTQEGKWFIVINSTLSYEERRFTVAHEIGHIFLGHMLTPIDDIAFLTSGRKPAEESSADMFALRLLSPACVLWALDIEKANDISALCRIPENYAKIRESRMKELIKRNKFLSSPVDRRLFENFRNFIELYHI